MKQKSGGFFYFNKRLTQKLNRIIHFPMTIVKARVGAGKTTAVSTYLKGTAAKTVWHFCEEDYPAFYTQFCAYMVSVHKGIRPEIYKQDLGNSPESTAAYLAVRMKESLVPPRIIYVLESKATAIPDDVMKFLTALCFQQVRDLHIVIILRSDSSDLSTVSDFDYAVNININLINDDDFRLTSEDVALAFQENGVPMVYEETDYLLYPIAGVVKQGTDAYIRTSFADDNDYAAYVQNFLDNSTFKSNETFSPSDQTVLISSCSDLVQDGRYALLCKLVKAD